MFVLRLILRNAFRHKLRTTLTMLGIVVAIVAFGVLRTIVDAWYAGVEASASTRLITRNAISLVFPLPLNYEQKLRQVPGVASVAGGNWFGGIYVTESNFFPQFAIQGAAYLDMYPEFRISAEERKAFLLDRQGAIAGRKTADRYGWKIGDQIPLRGTIFPGTWTFTLRAIYDGADAKVDETQFLFHWAYLNETIKARNPRRADQVGWYTVEIRDPTQAAEISERIDATFKNSLAETLTETEKAFQLGFVSMTEAILVAIQAVSYVIVIIIMAVMANTMAMTARERYSEYATMKAIGFGDGFVAGLIFAESVGIALAGGLLGIAITFPVAGFFGGLLGTLLPVFFVSEETILMQVGAALLVGIVAALIPAWRASRVKIVDGLRAVA
ncbi:MAG: FtsX-like permease family protein [Burkholderiales bacterium]